MFVYFALLEVVFAYKYFVFLLCLSIYLFTTSIFLINWTHINTNIINVFFVLP